MFSILITGLVINQTMRSAVYVYAQTTHDVAIIGVTVNGTYFSPQKVAVPLGQPIKITVVAENQGDFNETFTVTASYMQEHAHETTVISPAQTLTELAPKSNATLDFIWNTIDVEEMSYIVSAEATVVPNETDTADNEKSCEDTVHITSTKIYLEPSTIQTSSGQNFTLDIKIANVIDLFTWEVKLKWNSSLLEFVDIEESPLLKVHPTYFGKTVNQSLGYVHPFCTILGKYSGESAIEATLATVTFFVEGKGECVLNLYETVLLSSVGTVFKPRIAHTVDDGYFSNVAGLPMAIFTWTPHEPVQRQIVTFDGSASYDPDGHITAYRWDFGDGTNATGEIVEHAYVTSGTFNVVLTVTDNTTLVDVETTSIKVLFPHDVAILEVSPYPYSVAAGEHVMINVTVSNLGNFTEAFNVTIFYEDDVAGRLTVANLTPRTNRTLSFDWDTSQIVEGDYWIKAEASLVPEEGDTTNNIMSDGTITVLPEPQFLALPLVLAVVILAIAAIGILLVRKKKRFF